MENLIEIDELGGNPYFWKHPYGPFTHLPFGLGLQKVTGKKKIPGADSQIS